MSIEAMKQALEAIANSGDFLFNWHDCEPNNEREMSRYQDVLAMNEKAFNTLRTSIEQAEKQEPFGYLEIEDIESHSEYPHNCRSVNLWYEGGESMVAIYTTPPAAQRQWVGLTDDEIIQCTPNWIGTLEDVARAIEAKLREKNS